MPRSAAALVVSEDQQSQIEQWLAAMGTPQQVALRCRIVLAVGRGESEVAIASELEINRKTVRLWRERFAEEGLKSLWEIAPGRGRKATYSPERVKAVLDATLQSKPKGQTHWSCRLMAASQGISKSTVSNLWKSHNIKPHRTKTFKLSRDPKFLEKLTDVVGLYLNPPDQAIVLCVDEKSRIQALNRTQPHGTAEGKACLSKHPRFAIHHVPTSCSWLNLIERWFSELTNKGIRRDSFFSVDELIAAINDFLVAWNENLRPFVWTATVDSIVAKLARCRQTRE